MRNAEKSAWKLCEKWNDSVMVLAMSFEKVHYEYLSEERDRIVEMERNKANYEARRDVARK